MSGSLLASVVGQLERQPTTLEQIWDDYSGVWGQLGWNLPQVRLWMRCLPNIEETAGSGPDPTVFHISVVKQDSSSRLPDQIVAILKAAGRPIPLQQLAKKISAGQVVTEPMLSAAARSDSRLEVKGPFVTLR